MEASTIKNLKLRKHLKQRGGTEVPIRGVHSGTGNKKKKDVPECSITCFCLLPW